MEASANTADALPVDQRAMHRAALGTATGLVERIGTGDLDRATPCSAWTLGDLLAHMVGQHLGFAAATRTGDAPATAYAAVPFTPSNWERSVDDLLTAFAAADLQDRVIERELAPTALPISVLVGAQLLDTVVHSWDVATALGEQFRPPDDQIAAVLAIAAPIPDDERRTSPSAAFAPGVPVTGDDWQRTLGMLGRDPGQAGSVGLRVV